jgi:hypothetical protein
MRRKIILLTGLLGILGGGYLLKQAIETPSAIHQTTEGWVRFSSGKFKIDFPQEPSLEKRQLEVPRVGKTLDYQQYSSSLEKQIVYQAGFAQLPAQWTWLGKKTLLKGALEVILQNDKEAELLSYTFSTYRKKPVLDFHLKKGSTEIKGRLLMVGRTLYQLSVVTPTDLASDQQHALFLNSFDA